MLLKQGWGSGWYVPEFNMDNKELLPVVPRDVLVKQGISAVAYLAGGAFLLVMTIGARFRLLGLLLSFAALIIGVAAILSRDREDKKPGMVIAAAGVLGLLARFGIPILRPFAAFALGIGGLGLFAAGIWKGIRFLRGLKSRQ